MNTRIVASLFLFAWLVGATPRLALAESYIFEDRVAASDPSYLSLFGWSVALDGNRAIVGAIHDSELKYHGGAAYVFNAGSGLELHKLTPDDPQDLGEFGISVGISGNTAIAGATGNTSGIGYRNGAAYLFDVDTGNQRFKLEADDVSKAKDFGYAVGVSGNRAIVSAPLEGADSGAAYLFDTTTGQQLHRLVASDFTQDDEFGSSVAISGNRAIVGARYAFGNLGSAYLYNVETGSELMKIRPDQVVNGSQFGISTAIDDNHLLVGSYGAAYLFDSTTGEELFSLTADDSGSPTTVSQRFGSSVALAGNIAVVGAYFTDVEDQEYAGAVYFYDTTTGAQLGKLTASDFMVSDGLGISVAASGDLIVAGAFSDEVTFEDEVVSVAGSAYFFGPLPGDTNLDGDVDTADLTNMFQNFTGSVGDAGGKTRAQGDYDLDGDVDTFDITLGFQNFTGSLDGASQNQAVPEPSSLVLLALGLSVLGLWRRPGRASSH